MSLPLIKVTVLFTAALATLVIARRTTAAARHLLCVCALAGSLLLPLGALFAPGVLTLRMPVIAAVASSQAVAKAESWSSSTAVFVLWSTGCIALLLRLAHGHARILRIVRSATPVRPGLLVACVSVPIACGILRPKVLMPKSSSKWPGWQFDAAVRHELMHVRRRDLWANLIAQCACAIYWFHPLAWMLSRRLRIDQEIACDDAVLSRGFEPATYAEALLAVSRTSTSTLLPGCPMTTQTNLKNRISRLLDPSIARTTSRATFFRTAAGFAIVLAALGSLGVQKSGAQNKSDQIYRVGNGVTMPRVTHKVDPPYTEEARQAGIGGVVMLSVVVGIDGLAHDISIVKGIDAGLDRNAAETVQEWRFAPATLRGEPVAVRATIEVKFRLD